MAWTLRRAVPADRARIRELFFEMLTAVWPGRDPASFPGAELDKYFAGGEDWICLAEEDGRIVGYLAIEVYRAPQEYLYLDDISVTADRRGRGVGTDLLRAAERCARESGIRPVLLHVEKSNARARALYERLGWTVFRDDGSRLLMRRDVAPA